MEVITEIFKFIIYSLNIVIISKYILVKLLRNLGENLNLKPKTIGNISGIATSIPEFLTVCFSSSAGLISTSIYNILTSNIVNFVQYMFSIYLNKNKNSLQNKAIKISLFMVGTTILIPIAMLLFNIESNITMVPIFILLFIFFYFLDNNSHKLYLEKEQKKIEKRVNQEIKAIKNKARKTALYIVLLFLTGISLYIIGILLSEVLEKMCIIYNIPQFIIGIVLGIITSIPELITFFESQKHYKNTDNNLGVVEATNNLLSSNLLNLFIIQSIGILIYYIVNK